MLSAENFGEIFVRIIVAVLCGGILGWERERNNRPAGLRTHMLVALGSAVFTLLALQMQGWGGEDAQYHDPLRAVQGIIGGIGFLGAGSIIQAHGSVKGITTAATIWVVGALGVACGAGLYPIAVLTVLMAYLILTLVGGLENRWLGKPPRDLHESPPDESDDPNQGDHRTRKSGMIRPSHRGADPS